MLVNNPKIEATHSLWVRAVRNLRLRGFLSEENVLMELECYSTGVFIDIRVRSPFMLRLGYLLVPEMPNERSIAEWIQARVEDLFVHEIRECMAHATLDKGEEFIRHPHPDEEDWHPHCLGNIVRDGFGALLDPTKTQLSPK